MSLRRWLGLLPAVCLLAAVWPASWGGPFAYVTTHGTSMAPRFHTGDLAVVHPESSYRVGDVTAYHNEMLHTVVLHRIVAISQGHYTFKGDNNSWLDAERPVRTQLIGKLVVRVPQGGAWLHRLISPPLLAMCAFGLLGAGATTANRRRRGRRRMTRHAAPKRKRKRLEHPFRAAAMQAGAAALLLATVAVVTWSRPATGLVMQSVGHAQKMTLSYVATVKPSPAYPGPVVTAPTPIFRNVAKAIQLQLRYRGTSGDVRVDAELSTPAGWSYSLPLIPQTRIDGATAVLRAPLDLTAFDRRAAAAARATGLPSTPLNVTIVARVTGPADGHVFASRFPFSLTPLSLTATDSRALTVTSSTPAMHARSAAAMLHLLHRQITVSSARRITTGAALLAVLAVLALLAAGRRAGRGNESDRIARRWPELLVDVQPISTPPGRPVVDVPAFSELVRIAERYETLILHWSRCDVDTYLLQDDITVFRYRSTRGSGATLSVEDNEHARDQRVLLDDQTQETSFSS
jgi:signal peptidase I